MDARIVRARQRIVGFERRVQAERTGPGVADMEAVLGDDELAVIVDHRNGARHERQLMDDCRTVREFLFEQFLADDVEPEQPAGRRVEARAFAEFADHVGKNARACHAHAFPNTRSQAETAAVARSPTSAALMPGL